MKVILLNDVAKIGRRGAIVDVPSGYARNQLIPKGVARAATDASIAILANSIKNSENAKGERQVKLETLLNELKDNPIEIKADANDRDHLFAAIKVEQIVYALRERGFNLEAKEIILSEPIKALGTHSLVLKVEDLVKELQLTVVKKNT